MTILNTDNVIAGYKTANVLRGISISLSEGEIVSVVGRNGVGKSTLVKTIIGLLSARSGKIIFNNKDITLTKANIRAKSGIGYVPQGRGIFAELTVQENLRMGGLIGAKQKKLDFDSVFSYFPILKERLHQRGGTLSGGQQEMLAIARALINKPKLLLLDEPSDGVQPSIVEEIGSFLLKLKETGDITVLLVEQNFDLLQTVSDRAYAMEKGTVSDTLTKEDLNNDETLAAHIAV
ncbi:MAG: ABC transporter ATP-binding protein [Gammaproteobacteria bacterium]|nr:ABC transporter ATP-binding protein [Gammaproteobacteria bacterium]